MFFNVNILILIVKINIDFYFSQLYKIMFETLIKFVSKYFIMFPFTEKITMYLVKYIYELPWHGFTNILVVTGNAGITILAQIVTD